MKVKLYVVSDRQPAWVNDGIAGYQKRLPHTWRFELIEVAIANARQDVARAKRG
jgi:23S rRNA pseudoU1915 N3-methylase RlmH